MIHPGNLAPYRAYFEELNSIVVTDPTSDQSLKRLVDIFETIVDCEKGTNFLMKLLHSGNISKPMLLNLLSIGLNMSSRDAVGRTPLHYAVLTNKSTFCSILIDCGAAPNIADKLGNFPVDGISSKGQQNQTEEIHSILVR
jgi:ankyrin repeat protein